MNISLISFTKKGTETALMIAELLREKKHICRGCSKGMFEPADGIESISESLHMWTERRFGTEDALIFVGAAGIAVRAIAPFVKSKTTDPACIAVDERGSFVIPLLSGHIGGANELAEEIANGIGAVAVITTATDINGIFAVDEWAKKNDMYIDDMKTAKMISSQLLHGKNISFKSCIKTEGRLPKGLVREEECGDAREADGRYRIEVSISSEQALPYTLKLVPKQVCLGIGCKRGTSARTIETEVAAALDEAHISCRAVFQVASIDLKIDEAGLIEFSRMWELPFKTYTSKQLSEIQGEFNGSSFVNSITGVDNVCERSAVLLSGGGKLIIGKRAKNGVTVAAALAEKSCVF